MPNEIIDFFIEEKSFFKIFFWKEHKRQRDDVSSFNSAEKYLRKKRKEKKQIENPQLAVNWKLHNNHKRIGFFGRERCFCWLNRNNGELFVWFSFSSNREHSMLNLQPSTVNIIKNQVRDSLREVSVWWLHNSFRSEDVSVPTFHHVFFFNCLRFVGFSCLVIVIKMKFHRRTWLKLFKLATLSLKIVSLVIAVKQGFVGDSLR